PGHGKTIAAAYIVGARGRPVDALALGIFVTLSHTSGIVLVAVLASIGSSWLIPHRIEAYLALGTGLLVIGIGARMVWSQRVVLRPLDRTIEPGAHVHRHGEHGDHAHDHDAHDHHPDHAHEESRPPGYHSHGWGRGHTHDLDAIAGTRPSLAVLLGLGI